MRDQGMGLEGPKPVEIRGKPLHCLICGNGEFFTGRGLVITHGATAVGWELNNPKADLAACTACGYLHSFLDSLEDEGWG